MPADSFSPTNCVVVFVDGAPLSIRWPFKTASVSTVNDFVSAARVMIEESASERVPFPTAAYFVAGATFETEIEAGTINNVRAHKVTKNRAKTCKPNYGIITYLKNIKKYI